jgi:hypothetical protein
MTIEKLETFGVESAEQREERERGEREAARRERFFAECIKADDTISAEHRALIRAEMDRAGTWAWAEYDGGVDVRFLGVKIEEGNLVVEIDLIDCGYVARRKIAL